MRGQLWLAGGTPSGVAALLKAITVEMVFDLLGVRLDGPQTIGISVAIGWRFPDLGEAWTLRLERSALSAWPALDDDVDVTLTMGRETLTAMLVDPASIGDALEDGRLTIDGDADALGRLFGPLEQPTPMFNVVEP